MYNRDSTGATRRWLLAGAVCAAIIAFLAFLPPTRRLNLHESEALHEGAHIAAFALTAFFLFRGTRAPSTHLKIAGILVLLAVGTELGEHLLFKSPMEYMDLAADAAGVLIGALGAFAL